MLFATQKGFAEGRQSATILAEYGIASETWSRDEVLEREPSIAPDIAGGVYYTDDAQICPADFVGSLAKISQAHGANILESTRVCSISVSKGEIAAVHTTQGDFRPGSVVLAAGAESSTLARDLNIDLPIEAGKGYSFSVTTSTVRPSRPLLLSEAKVAVTPFRDKVRFAGTLALSGLDYSIDASKLNSIRENSSPYFRSTLPAQVEEPWTGLRPCTPDGLPIISPVPGVRNLVVASGHGMLGISLGPITGKLATQLACNEPPDINLSALAISRFSPRRRHS
jgi:D-amino-acid dehydrogenase